MKTQLVEEVGQYGIRYVAEPIPEGVMLTPAPTTTNPPKEIFLQLPSKQDEDDYERDITNTWSEKRITPEDIRYVIAVGVEEVVSTFDIREEENKEVAKYLAMISEKGYGNTLADMEKRVRAGLAIGREVHRQATEAGLFPSPAELQQQAELVKQMREDIVKLRYTIQMFVDADNSQLLSSHYNKAVEALAATAHYQNK